MYTLKKIARLVVFFKEKDVFLNTFQSVRLPSCFVGFFLIFRLEAENSNRMYHWFNNRPRGGPKSCPEGRLCNPPSGSHQCNDLPQCQGHARG